MSTTAATRTKALRQNAVGLTGEVDGRRKKDVSYCMWVVMTTPFVCSSSQALAFLGGDKKRGRIDDEKLISESSGKESLRFAF